MIVGASIEIGTQLISTGSVDNWSAVAGSAVQGGLTGAAAGLTCGASLVTTAATSAAANAAGGFINREIQGKETTGTDVAVDAALGLATGVGSKYFGKAVEKGLDGLSNQAKGKLGEAITEIKYTVRGYKKVGDNPNGNAIIKTGEKTPLGNYKKAHYDFGFKHRITGKQIIVESKYNKSGFTNNQKKALKNVKVDFKVDRTTSEMIGNWATSGYATQWGSYNAQAN